MKFTTDFVRSLPKVLLHDHLDGGLRPQTIIELANSSRYDQLPSKDATQLAGWFHRNADCGSLPQFLQGFEHTCGVMQTEEALERVAYEMLEDMRKDGVFYVETRFAPLLHTRRGMYVENVVRAVIRGMEQGKKDFGVHYGVIFCALRNMSPDLTDEVARLAVEFRPHGVVGFDLAGEEGGYPPKKHVDAFHYIQRENFNITIHAGEAVRLREDGHEYVLLRSDVYDRLAENGYDDGPWEAEELDRLREESVAALDKYGKDA